MPDRYHHGDLRRALLDEAAAVLDLDGPQALSLRDLARRVGVSPTAPYHHFADKAALISALALAILDDLDAEMARVLADTADDRRQSGRAMAVGRAYVGFALDHPSRFSLAFRPEMGTPFGSLTVGDELPEDLPAFRRLVAAVDADGVGPGQRRARVIGFWGLAHGLASLLVDGPLRVLAGDREGALALVDAALAEVAS